MKNEKFKFEVDESAEFRNEFLKYISFWPYLIVITLAFLIFAFLYLRYTSPTLKTTSVIEIMDESQNSEMALPTELTVFNRSMINLENEITRLKSYSINSAVVKEIKANVIYFQIGDIKNTQSTAEDWYEQYDLYFKINTDTITEKLSFSISSDNNKLIISSYDSSDDFIKSFNFNSLSTLEKSHDLPFELSIRSDKFLNAERKLLLVPIKDQGIAFRDALEISALGKESDQLSISLTHQNHQIAQNYLNKLVSVFDNDGIADRKLEYRRTIEFVNVREQILKNDLNIIELRKQNYKQENNLSEISLDANNNIDLKSTYNSEIFQLESQKQIAEYLIDLLKESERYRFVNEGGSNNLLVKSLEPQLDNLIENISVSLKNLTSSIDLKLANLKLKENEFDNEYNRVPENEKTLRAIERELSIKEALYLLLLQKREEASINLAVVKPTIKVIDYAITDFSSKKPSSFNIYFFTLIAASLTYFLILYIRFFMDNKIHNKDQLTKLLNPDIPIIGEIPYIRDIDTIKDDTSSSRSIISESIRMLLSNLRFTLKDNTNVNSKKGQTIIFSSSIKGEGKTLGSVNTALSLANDINREKKVILIGTDLRNPQVHKRFGVEKSKKGVSEIIYNNDYKSYKNYINRFENLDVLFSGAIPPNPTSLLASDAFKNLIELVKKDYDFIIIDSAPCLLVSDTFQYIDIADSVVYLFRANFTDSKIIDFINEIFSDKKIKNINIVLNAVGNSSSYGYKYGYQYGYKYGYKYSYNYGYGYGYTEDK